ncbi:MAG: hypothetical protein ACSW8K_01965 [bacterium]
MKTTTKKRFSVHDLYPADYCFDWDAFEADPDNYQFTAEDIAYSNAMELEKYEAETPMTPCEKRALRRWVASGHSVRETPPSKYGCIYPSHPVPDFLEVYRTDKELDKATKGMSAEQRIAYLKDYVGYVDDTEEEREERNRNERLHEQTPDEVKEKIRRMQREIFYTWMFLSQEGIYEDAEEYVREHMDEPIPFEDEW